MDLRRALIFCSFLVLTSSQPVGFTMTRGRKEGAYINFEFVATNENAELSQEVGAFRCSQPGLYFFSFTALPPRKSVLKISLRKNRIPITTIFASEGTHSSLTGSLVLWLQPSDIVYPFIEDGEIYESTANTRALTSFSGFQVSSSFKAKDSLQNVAFRTDDDILTQLGEPDPKDNIEKLFKADHLKNATTTQALEV